MLTQSMRINKQESNRTLLPSCSKLQRCMTVMETWGMGLRGAVVVVARVALDGTAEADTAAAAWALVAPPPLG